MSKNILNRVKIKHCVLKAIYYYSNLGPKVDFDVLSSVYFQLNFTPAIPEGISSRHVPRSKITSRLPCPRGGGVGEGRFGVRNFAVTEKHKARKIIILYSLTAEAAAAALVGGLSSGENKLSVYNITIFFYISRIF